ncbi:MAG: DUF2335 domain-containing protein [Methylacidiphilales bacterium]|nr:DUF2335 domain-containing protein [Candidatus Methylacidiphilales bacterium]
MADTEPQDADQSHKREISLRRAVNFERLFSEEPLKSLSPEQRSALEQTLTRIEISASQSISYSGPLPHPSLLAKYNDVIPNGAERMMVMAEKQSDHRLKIETMVVNNQQRQSTVGQYFALVITIAGLALSGWLIVNNHDTAGSAIGVATIGSVAAAFIAGRTKQRSELDSKRRAVEAAEEE